ncbi:hypothetical protein ACFVYC_09840 [Pseudarthrobacter sp. NPDC058329]|uniref:hypothetical protein n=1 Tax=Pseudarthrobacter sp. NPDC058329 TaxID=3346448 RepID=UPI0036D949E0
MSETADYVECSIVIAVGADSIWPLVSRPEWFITRTAVPPVVIEGNRPGERVVLDERYGALAIHTVVLCQPRYAAFRWVQQTPEGEDMMRPTLVEFWVGADGDGMCSLRVRESFFDFTGMAEVQRRDALDDNAAGWSGALAEAKAYLEA